jgi:hypothetical protein
MYESEHDDAHWEQVIAELNEKISDEEQLWNANKFGVHMLDINVYLLQMKINTCVSILEKLGVSNKEIEAQFKVECLEQLRRDRGMLTEAKLAASRPDIAVPPKKNLLGPNGQPMI